MPRMRALHAWLDEERDRLVLWLPVFMGTGVLLYYQLRFEPALLTGPAAASRMRGLSACRPHGCRLVQTEL